MEPSGIERGQGMGWEKGMPLSLPPPQIQAASEILENGEDALGPGPSLDRMLSSSSSVSSLNSSTVRGRGTAWGTGRHLPVSRRVDPV